MKFRFWWSETHGLIRTIDRAFPEVLADDIWVPGSPYVLDAITGMGEDPHSCGEWVDELEPEQAIALAKKKKIDLFSVDDDSKKLEATAIKMALEAHNNQRYGDLPYQAHLEHVQKILTQFGYNNEPHLVIAAWLHDAIEDTSLTVADIENEFGKSIADTVYRVTDEPGSNRTERKKKTYPKIYQHREATVVKLCDRIANVEASQNNKKKFKIYQAEQPALKAAVFSPGIADKLWSFLDSLLAKPFADSSDPR